MKDEDRFVYLLYFTLTTLTTVGYGDYSATNSYEAIFICFILVAGVTFFSVLIGSASDSIA